MSTPKHGGGSPAASQSSGSSENRSQRYTIKATGDAAKNYDFVSARPPAKTTNLFESIAHLIKSCLGGGIVAVHESYMSCGLMTALLLNIILGFLVAYCMHILVRSAQRMYGRVHENKMSYPDLAEAALCISPFPRLRKYSKCFRYAVDVTIGIDLFGSCCVYQVVIARTIKQLVDNTEQVSDGGVLNTRAYLAMLLIPCIIICMIIHLKYLAPFSVVANIFILTVVISTIYYATKSAHWGKDPLSFPKFKSVGGLFEFIGVCVFSMEGVGVSMAIENHMTQPKKFPWVLAGGMSVVISLVMMMGFFGYYGFGENAKSPVTINFPMEPFPLVLKGFMALMIYVTFALNFWIPFDLVWFYLKQRHPEDKHWLWERIYRAISVTIITLVAIIFPDVSSFMGLLGSFCLSNMGFIYPAFIQLSLDWTDPGLGFGMWRLWRAIFIMAFGVVLCIVGTYANAKSLVQSTWS